MAWLWLLLAFGVFMALLRSVYAVNRAALRRYGYEPFSLPNAALMLVVNLLLLSALAPAEPSTTVGDAALRQTVMLGIAAVLATGLLVVVARRSSIWLALYAVAVMSVAAIAVLPSLVFMRFAAAAQDADDDARSNEPPDRRG
jgi:hypothetical protein